jgi:hypothetical protein
MIDGSDFIIDARGTRKLAAYMQLFLMEQPAFASPMCVHIRLPPRSISTNTSKLSRIRRLAVDIPAGIQFRERTIIDVLQIDAAGDRVPDDAALIVPRERVVGQHHRLRGHVKGHASRGVYLDREGRCVLGAGTVAVDNDSSSVVVIVVSLFDFNVPRHRCGSSGGGKEAEAEGQYRRNLG